MKNNIFILIASVFFVNALSAVVVVTSNIDQTTFNDAFENDAIWFAQLQPGGTGTTHPDNEFELGGAENIKFSNNSWLETDPYYEGNTSIINRDENDFVISVSESNFLSVIFNGIGTPNGSEFGITSNFNTIWIGLYNDNIPPIDTMAVDNHLVDGDSVLPDMENLGAPTFTAFKFYMDDKVNNIGSIVLTGSIIPDLTGGASFDQDWTYTVFATHDSSIIPEPSTYALVLTTLVFVLVVCRRQ